MERFFGALMVAVIWFIIGFSIGQKPSSNITPCICIDEFKARFDERSYQYHTGELNYKQYKDSLYTDLQKYYILGK